MRQPAPREYGPCDTNDGWCNIENANQYDADNILTRLELPADDELGHLQGIRALFMPGLTSILHLYKSQVEATSSDRPTTVKLALLGRSINDLVSGFHLVRQGYTPQAYAVLRPILESLDIVKLIDSRPELAEFWLHGGDDARKTFQPSAVRKALGRPTYDEIYSHFCEMAHPRFSGGRAMMAERVENEGDTRQLSIWIGGVRFEHEIVFAVGFMFVLQCQLWSNVFQLGRLPDASTSITQLRGILDDFETFNRDYTAAIVEDDDWQRLTAATGDSIRALRNLIKNG